MANNQAPSIQTAADRLYWRTVHTHTRHIYEQLADSVIEANGHAQQVAYEALGIVHAMAHIALTNENPMGAGLCTIELEDRHRTAADGGDGLLL